MEIIKKKKKVCGPPNILLPPADEMIRDRDG